MGDMVEWVIVLHVLVPVYGAIPHCNVVFLHRVSITTLWFKFSSLVLLSDTLPNNYNYRVHTLLVLSSKGFKLLLKLLNVL